MVNTFAPALNVLVPVPVTVAPLSAAIALMVTVDVVTRFSIAVSIIGKSGDGFHHRSQDRPDPHSVQIPKLRQNMFLSWCRHPR